MFPTCNVGFFPVENAYLILHNTWEMHSLFSSTYERTSVIDYVRLSLSALFLSLKKKEFVSICIDAIENMHCLWLHTETRLISILRYVYRAKTAKESIFRNKLIKKLEWDVFGKSKLLWSSPESLSALLLCICSVVMVAFIFFFRLLHIVFAILALCFHSTYLWISIVSAFLRYCQISNLLHTYEVYSSNVISYFVALRFCWTIVNKLDVACVGLTIAPQQSYYRNAAWGACVQGICQSSQQSPQLSFKWIECIERVNDFICE